MMAEVQEDTDKKSQNKSAVPLRLLWINVGVVPLHSQRWVGVSGETTTETGQAFKHPDNFPQNIVLLIDSCCCGLSLIPKAFMMKARRVKFVFQVSKDSVNIHSFQIPTSSSHRGA